MGGHAGFNYIFKLAIISIASDAKLSSAVDCLGMVLIGMDLPATWTTSDVTLQGTLDGGAFKAIVDEDNAAITFAAVAQNQIALIGAATPMVAGLSHLKIRSTTDQAADRVVRLMFAIPNP